MPKLGNLASRVLVAVVAVPPLILAIFQDSALPVWCVVFAASLVAMYEFFAMNMDDKTDRWASTVIGGVACAVLFWLSDTSYGTLLACAIAVVPTMLYYVFRFGDMETVAARVSASVMGIFYGGFLITFIPLLKKSMPDKEFAGYMIVMLLASAWASDTGGYFAGKALGKRKLYPAVSPNKTWAGSIGGALAAVAAGVGLKAGFDLPLSWVHACVLTGVGAVLGQIGDLCESLIKRSTGVKDSGAILPGHGGILDRVDAVIFIAPFFYFYLLLIVQSPQ